MTSPSAPAPLLHNADVAPDLSADAGQLEGSAPAPAGRPLRIAFCIDNMNVGGTELNALRTASHLVRLGVDLSVFSLSTEGPLLERYAELGVPVHFTPIDSLYGMSAWRSGRALAATVRREHIQVVHAHDFYSNIFAAAWARAGGAAFVASRRWWEGPGRRAQRWANRASYLLADRVLANSEAVGELLRQREHVSAAAVVVVRNFLESDAFAPPPAAWREAFAAELELPPERLVVGVVASLQPIKDHASLLRAVALLAPAFPQLLLVLVGGDGGSRAELEQLALELGIAGRMRLAGLRPAMPSAHHLFDISALTSVSEGLPNTVLEAMAAARPVVATRVGAVPDAVVAGETGLLVPPRDPRALADALARLLADAGLRRAWGEAGRERARTRYSPGAALGQLLAMYRAVAVGSMRAGHRE